jgi:2-dehydropantoate 2-reductase
MRKEKRKRRASTMTILVFGAGAIGSLMAHYLCKAGNDVTVVARSTYEELSKNGLVIRHYLQKVSVLTI